MRVRKRSIAVLLIVILGLAALVLATPESAPPVAVRVVSVVEEADTRRVTVDLMRLNAAARFAEAHHLQIRVGREWQPPLSLPSTENGYLLAGTNSQRFVFDFPRQTAACRLSLGYRVGSSPYCQAYFFFSRNGVSQKFPAVSKVILGCLPHQSRLRHFECAFEIPAETHNHSGAEAGRLF